MSPSHLLALFLAQHEHHQDQQQGHDHQAMMEVAEVAPAEPSLAARESDRIASGTAWQPAGTPHVGWHWNPGGWRLMVHGLFFGGYDWQSGPRGGKAAAGIGWVMAMARRDGQTNALVLRAMLSPEPWTVRDGGYPLLLQTGETYQGQPLHDRQHPHDLLMELGAVFTQQLTPGLALQGYAALAGEPALGPVAFPHRASALCDAMATLGHHWLDSTHITFGVLTLGVLARRVKLEGSWFNGHEPDERRWDVDLHRPDAWSVRLSVAPADSLTGQVSFGHLPGGGHHAQDLQRGTASLSHRASFLEAGHADTLLALGLNRMDGTSLAALAESTVDLDGYNVLFTRLEFVQKAGHDLALPAPLDAQEHDVLSGVLGYLRNFGPVAGLLPGLGLRVAGTYVPPALGPFYGNRRLPLGAMVYVRLLPGPASHH
jgi:hypothetical protein